MLLKVIWNILTDIGTFQICVRACVRACVRECVCVFLLSLCCCRVVLKNSHDLSVALFVPPVR